MIQAARRVAFLRLLSSAVTMQALLSGSSFLVGLILIRRTTDTQYGYYVLVTNAVLLLTLLQQSFIQPQVITRMPACDLLQRAALVGGLYRDQRRWWPALAAVGAGSGLLLRLLGIIDNQMLFIVLAGTAALTAALFREFFRIVLLSYRRPDSVLRADAVYVVLLVCGAWFASGSTTLPAAFATLTLSAAAVVGGILCTRSLWRFEPWDIRGSPGILRQIAPLGFWAAGGTATHWLFSQGYSYLVAGTLDVAAVAAIAATRLLTMPINLLSTGLGSMMLPSISAWLQTHSARKVFGRQVLFSLGVAALALAYLGTVWIFRDWIFIHVFKKHSASFDALLLLWSLVVLVMLFRDQLVYLLIVRGRFRSLAVLTFGSAVAALLLSYAAMQRYGVAGALAGVLVGELLNVSGIIYLCFIETRRIVAAPAQGT